MKTHLLSLAVVVAMAAANSAAGAADAPAPASPTAGTPGSGADSPASGTPAADASHPLTWNGLTLYGVVDIGVATQSHGAPISDYFAQGLQYGISSNSNRSVTALAPNGLSQSRLGLKGAYDFNDELSGIFTLETRFSPLSGEIANGPKSLIQNNGQPLANQVSANDSSQAGQIFSAAAFAGFKSKTYGTLTFGRQNGLLYDNVLAYDPQGGSYAFSLIGFSSVASGGGYSEYNRLNDSARYNLALGPVRLGLQYQPSGQEVGGTARQLDLGTDIAGLSADFTYANKRDAISLANFNGPLTTAQQGVLAAAGLSLNNALKATVANTNAWSLMARYEINALKAFAGYEHITYDNPNTGSQFIQVGSSTVGGYFIGALTTNSFNLNKTLQIDWLGLKYAFTPQWRLTGAFYHYHQNSYATGTTAGCTGTGSTACGGAENALSLVGEFQYNRYLDLYAGAMRTEVSGGLDAVSVNVASGSTVSAKTLPFLASSNLSAMVGVRVTF